MVDPPTEGGNGVFQSPLISFTGGTLAGESNGTVDTATVTDATVLDAAKLARRRLRREHPLRHGRGERHPRRAPGEPGEVSIEPHRRSSPATSSTISRRTARAAAENITLSPDLFPAGIFTPTQFGYDNLALDVSWDSSRDVAAKTMTIRDFTVDVHDGGELSVNGVVGNLPDPRVLDDAGAASKASKAEVHQLTVRYRDNSLAGRVLDALAKRQGLTRNEYTQQLTAALPFLLLTLNNPAFQAQVTAAVEGLPAGPALAHHQPRPGFAGFGLGYPEPCCRSNPATVPDRLKASVTANAPE